MFGKFTRNHGRWLGLLLCVALSTGLIWGATRSNLLRRTARVLKPAALTSSKTPAPAAKPLPAPTPTVELAAPVQSGGPYNLVKSVIPGGGGQSANGNTNVNGSAGQAAVDVSSGGAYTLGSGFWAGGALCPTLTLAPTSLPAGTVNAPYSQLLAASGGTAPYTFQVTAGALPMGLQLSLTGQLAGTPTSLGTFPFTVTATDANQCTGTQTYSLIINCPTLSISPASLPAGIAGTSYSQMLTGSGGTGPYSFTLASGTLPLGITLASSGLLSGTTSQTGNFNFTVDATDSLGCHGTQAYLLVINCPALTVNPASLPNGQIQLPYPATSFTATGGSGPYTFALTAGALPPGLNLVGGLLSGTPTQVGPFNFTITATDALHCTGARSYSLLIKRGFVKADFDGDGKTDLSVFRPTAVDPTPDWLALNSSNGLPFNFSWGGGYAPYFDVPVPGDYDGDGKADHAIWRGADTFWYLRRSSDGQAVLVYYGANYAPYFDIPTPGDFDGDGKTDIAVYRRSGTWFVRRSSDGGDTIVNHGQAGDVPLAADFDGDGKCDFGLFRPDAVTSNWLILQSSTGTVVSYQWGGGYAPYFDTPMPADYDGDGKADLAIWRGQDSIWYIRPSANPGNPILKLWGANYAPYNDIPTPGDYDGDGKADIAVWRRDGTWYILRSLDESYVIQAHGQAGDTPLPSTGTR